MRSRLRAWLDHVRQNEAQLVLVLSLVIGALVGLVVVAFILLTGRLAARMYPAGGAPWRRFLVPTVGALVTGYFLFRFFPQARGSGIPQTKFALFIGEGVITLQTVIGKFVCCATSLASGIALGREGPSVHIGAGLASVLGRRLGLSPERVKALMPVGCSAALAAAFNTPIAAVLFSLEEVMGDLHAPILGSVVLSSATSWIVLHLFLGDAPLFHVAGYRLAHPSELLVYALLGIVGGLGSVAFVKLLLALRARFARLPAATAWLHPAIGGVTIGLLGLFVPQVLGVGYDYVERVLNGDIVLTTLALLAILKIVGTAVCYASGNAGGIFGPSLFIGAAIGGSVGAAAHALLPTTTAEPGAYALVGMGTAFAGIIRTPLTSVIMIFELTRDYSIIVPLMISNLLAFYVSHRLQRVPIYEALALQDGIHLPHAESRGYLGGARVGQVMRTSIDAFELGTAIRVAADRLRDLKLEAWPLRDDSGVRAMVQLSALEEAVAEGLGDQPLSTLLERHAPELGPHLHPDQSLSLALERMGESGSRVLPVVRRTDVRQLLGVASLADILGGFRLAPSPTLVESPASVVTTTGHRAFVSTLGAVAVVMVVLIASNAWLAARERAETGHEAAQLFSAGIAFENGGKYGDAVDRLRAAAVLQRGNRQYETALARVLLGAGKSDEAERVLDEVLRRLPTDGEASLLMARVKARAGDSASAASYYHRAIDGAWPAEAERHRLEARLELVDHLAAQGANEALLGELLPLQAHATDPAVELRIASLYVTAGAPGRALALLRPLQRGHPGKPEVLAAIGDAQLALRNVRAAQTAYAAARRLDPGNAHAERQLALCNEALSVDPARRGLDSAERHRRSLELVQRVAASVARCRADANWRTEVDPTPIAPERRSAAARSAAAESNLDLAERLWQLRTRSCREPASGSDAVLELLLTAR
jgi:CIC family chloride channel protein